MAAQPPAREYRRFLYWVPGAAQPGDDDLRRLGLGHLLDGGRGWTPRHADSGPDGVEGNVVALDAPPGTLGQEAGYRPAAGQVWKPRGHRTWWLGWYEGALPRPHELLRADALRGHFVQLGDGEAWLVPIARRADLATKQDLGVVLPRHIDFDDDGEPVLRVEDRFAAFSERIEGVWTNFCEWVEDKGGVELDERGWLDAAVQALGFSYHVGRAELGALKALTTANLEDVVAALLDVPTMLAVAKQMVAAKKASAEPAP